MARSCGFPPWPGRCETIAEGGAEAFYKGDIAARMAAFIQEQGGCMETDDLAGHASDWEEPIAADYRGVTCWECPPNGQGVAALEALNIIEGFDIAGMGAQTPDAYHHLIEAMRLAFADAFQYVADPAHVRIPTDELISKDFAAKRRALIDPQKAMATVPYGKVHEGSDTVYISAVDGEGNACSFIYSIYSNFGSGLVVPGTGIVLHNRGGLFSMERGHANALAGGKRPYHTIIPGLATKDGELYLCYGVMGAFMQPQGHLQAISNLVDHGMDPQQALNALRFIVTEEDVALEEGLSPDVYNDLKGRGHNVRTISSYYRGLSGGFGGAQLIQRDPDTGVLRGASGTAQGRLRRGVVDTGRRSPGIRSVASSLLLFLAAGNAVGELAAIVGAPFPRRPVSVHRLPRRVVGPDAQAVLPGRLLRFPPGVPVGRCSARTTRRGPPGAFPS